MQRRSAPAVNSVHVSTGINESPDHIDIANVVERPALVLIIFHIDIRTGGGEHFDDFDMAMA